MRVTSMHIISVSRNHGMLIWTFKYVQPLTPIIGQVFNGIFSQFILDAYSCCRYITQYVSKAANGISKLLRATAEELRRDNISFKQRMWKYGNVFSNSVETCCQVCTYKNLYSFCSIIRKIIVHRRPYTLFCKCLSSTAVVNAFLFPRVDLGNECSF